MLLIYKLFKIFSSWHRDTADLLNFNFLSSPIFLTFRIFDEISGNYILVYVCIGLSASLAQLKFHLPVGTFYPDLYFYAKYCHRNF